MSRLAWGGLLAMVTTVPFSLTTIGYRHRDHGQAYLRLVIGVGVWNLLFVAQLHSDDQLFVASFSDCRSSG